MTKDNEIHPALVIACFVMLGITVCAAVAMEKFPFSPALDTTKLEAGDLMPRRADVIRPKIDVK